MVNGTIIVDSSLTGNDGTVLQDLPLGIQSVAGRFDGALSLAGDDDDYVIISPTAGFGGAAVSLSLWVKQSPADAGVMYSYAVPADASEFAIGVDGSGKIAATVNGTSYTAVGTSVADGQWHHVAVTWQSGTLVVYQDGRQVATATLSGGTIDSGGVTVLGHKQTTLGGGFAPADAYIGDLDELAAFNRVLTPAEVLMLATQPGDCALLAGQLLCSVGMLPPGASITFTAVVTTDSTLLPGTNLLNTVTVKTNTPDPDPSNNTDDANTVVKGLADLSVVKSGTLTATAGGAISYTLVVSNAGPSAAQNVSVGDNPPAGVTVNSIVVARTGSGVTACAGFACGLGTVAVGEVVTLTVFGAVASNVTGTITNTATVNSTTPDPNTSNNTDQHPTVVTQVANLVIAKRDWPQQTDQHPTVVTQVANLVIAKRDLADPTVAGQNLTYEILVTNNGPSDAQVITVTDKLPDNTSYVGNTDSCVQGPIGTLTCRATGSLAAGASTSFQVTVLVGSAVVTGTTLINTVTLTSTTPLGPNSKVTDTETTTVTTVADLSIDLTSPPNVVAGESMTVTAVVANAGPSNALGTVVTVTLPPSTTFASVVLPSGWFSTTGTNNTLILTTTNPFTSGASFTFPIVVDVDPATQPGTVLEFVGNTASQTPETNLANNVDNTFTTVLGSADLSVSKSGTLTATAGGAISYTLVVSNAGPAAAQNVSVGDNLPAGVTVNSIVVARTGSGVTACAGFACSLGTVAAGEVVTLTVFGAVDSNVTGVITNTTTVNSTTPDPDPTNNTDEHPTTVVALTKLTIEKTDLLDPVGKDQTLAYNIRVTNEGPSDARNVIVTDTLDSRVTYQGNTDSCVLSGVSLTCSLGTIPAGGASSFLVTVQTPNTGVVSGTLLINNVVVTSATPVDSTSVLTANETTRVVDLKQPPADLSIVKSAEPTPTVTAGNRLTYTLVVSNGNPTYANPATGVVVGDALPPGVSYVRATASRNDVICVGDVSGQVLCTIGSLAFSETVVITVVVDVDADQAGAKLTNWAQVSGDQEDPILDNNTSTTQTDVVGEAKLVIAKRDLNDPTTAGAQLTYEVVVTNTGPSDAANVVVTDTIPLSTTYVSNTDSCVQSTARRLTCSLGVVPAGSSTSFQVTVQVASSVLTGTSLVNRVVLTSATPVATGSILSDTEPTKVKTAADLAIDLTSPPNVVAGESMTVTADIRNLGPSDAAGTVVTVTLPPSTTFESIVLPSGWFSSTVGNSLILTTSNPFTSGASLSFPIVVAVDPATKPGTNLEFVGDVLSATPETNLLNNRDTTRTSVAGEADLVVDKSGQTEVVAGETITYTVVITNNGPSTAQSVSLADLVPAGIAGVSFSVKRAAGTSSCGAVCLLGDMTAGEVITVTVVGTVNSSVAAGAILTNTATVASPTPDPNPNNNTDDHGTPVTDEANLVIAKRSLADPTVAGQNLTYEILVTNNGPSDAQVITVTDKLPDNTSYVSSTDSCVQGPIGTLTCRAAGSLAAGASTSFQVTVFVSSSVAAGSTLTNSVELTTTTPLGPNSKITATETTTVTTLTDLSIDLSSPPSVVAGESMTVTAVVANAGAEQCAGHGRYRDAAAEHDLRERGAAQRLVLSDRGKQHADPDDEQSVHDGDECDLPDSGEGGPGDRAWDEPGVCGRRALGDAGDEPGEQQGQDEYDRDRCGRPGAKQGWPDDGDRGRQHHLHGGGDEQRPIDGAVGGAGGHRACWRDGQQCHGALRRRQQQGLWRHLCPGRHCGRRTADSNGSGHGGCLRGRRHGDHEHGDSGKSSDA